MLELYTYRARVRSVYDGDTVKVDIDLGLGIWARGRSIRLYGIDTPEVRGEERPEGLEVRDWLRSQIPVGTEILLRTYKDKSGKYGRLLGELYLPDDDISLNRKLLDNGYAVPLS